MRIRTEDMVIERIRRTGPGGQHRNKKATGVRVTHLPTGIVVMATEERSQSRNLENAFERLERRLEKILRKPKPRRKTAPTGASREKRLRVKRSRAQTKSLRGPVKWSD